MDSFNISWPPTPVQCNGVCQNEAYITIQEVKQSGQSGCPKCMLIYVSVYQYCPEDLLINFYLESAGVINGAYISESGTWRPLLRFRLFYLGSTPEPIWNFIKPGKFLLSSRREECHSLLNGWINNCNSTHRNCTAFDPTLPKRVLDVGTDTSKRLFLHISSGEVASYTALSHCWGPNGILLKTTTSTIKDYQQGIDFQCLPKNFQDAMTVTRSIGIRYLWVDSLCIVQNDTTDWEVESSKMSFIYRDAYLIIAATQATDSYEGFLDRKDVPQYFGEGIAYDHQSIRDIPVQTGQIKNPDSTVSRIYIQDTGLGGAKQRHHNTVTCSPLNQRAWVLQENILPRRIVHFTCHEVLWECIECLRCECVEMDEIQPQQKEVNLIRNAHFFNFSKHYYDSSVTLHRSWLGLLEASCGLAISYESDRLPALSGLANLWKMRGAGIYLAGLWQDNILDSLMWKAWDKTKIYPPKNYIAPSWSPFGLGYTMDNQKPVSARFQFLGNFEGISEGYAKVVNTFCTPKGKDEMGAVKDGYLVLWTLVAKVCSESALRYTFHWDRGNEDSRGQELTLVLIGYYDFPTLVEDNSERCPRAIITVPSDRIAGAYKRIVMIAPDIDSRSEKWLSNCFKGLVEQEVKLV